MRSRPTRWDYYLRVIQEAEKHMALWLIGEVFNPHEFELTKAIVEARKKGLSQTEIMIAIALGEGQGCQKGYSRSYML